MHWGTRLPHDVWGAEEIYITECDLPTTAEGDAEGFDTDRIVWLRAYLAQLQRATADGVLVRGSFHWSTMDNVEWFMGVARQVRTVPRRYGNAGAHAQAQRRLVPRRRRSATRLA